MEKGGGKKGREEKCHTFKNKQLGEGWKQNTKTQMGHSMKVGKRSSPYRRGGSM